MSKASKTPEKDPADAYDAFRVVCAITMAAWRIVTGKPGQTSEKQRARKAAVLAAFHGGYSRKGDYATPKARRKAAKASIEMTPEVLKIARKCRAAMPKEGTQQTLPGTDTGKGKGKARKAPAKRPAGDHVYAMQGIRFACPGEPNGKVHPLYASACAWVKAHRAENGGTCSGHLVANAIHAGEIAAPKGKGKRKGK